MTEVVIVSAVRTPIGKLGGSLASLNAVALGTIASQAAIEQAGIDPARIQQAILAMSCRRIQARMWRGKLA